MLFKNQWTLSQFLLNLTRGYGDFEDLEPELLRLSEFGTLAANYRSCRISRERIYGHKGHFNSSPGNRRTCLKKLKHFLEQCPVGKVLEIGVSEQDALF